MKSLGLLADTRRHASNWRRWVLSLSSRNQNNYRRNSELRISTQTFLTVFQTFTHWSDAKRSRFTQRCFKHLSLKLSFLLKLKKNLSLGKWRWDINNICHLLPAFQLILFFFFSLLLVSVRSYLCTEQEAVQGRWVRSHSYSAVHGRVGNQGHFSTMSCNLLLSRPPSSFFHTQVRLQLLPCLMYSMNFSISQNHLALLISVSKNTFKRKVLAALPRRKIKLLKKKKNHPTTFKECRMFRCSKLFKSHYGRKPFSKSS